MVKFFATLVLLLSATLSVSAEKQTYSGYVDDKYRVYVYLDVNYKTGKVTGKYCYESTYNKYGDKPSSYLYMSGTYSRKTGEIQLRVTDHKGNYVETWSGIQLPDVRTMHIEGTITMKNGKKLPVYVSYWFK